MMEHADMIDDQYYKTKAHTDDDKQNNEAGSNEMYGEPNYIIDENAAQFGGFDYSDDITHDPLENGTSSTFALMSNVAPHNWEQHYDLAMFSMHNEIGPSTAVPPPTTDYQSLSSAIVDLDVPLEEDQNYHHQYVSQNNDYTAPRAEYVPMPYVNGVQMPAQWMVYDELTSGYTAHTYYNHNYPLVNECNNGAAAPHYTNGYAQLHDEKYYYPVYQLNQPSNMASDYGSSSNSSNADGSSAERVTPPVEPLSGSEWMTATSAPAMMIHDIQNVRTTTQQEQSLMKLLDNAVVDTAFPENAIVCGNPYDVYCPVAGRMSLLSAARTYDVTIAEISRRVNQPEVLNASYLNSILRKAKNKDGGTIMRQHFAKYGIDVPAGRRKSVESSLFTALSEGEAIQMSEELDLLVSSCYSPQAFADLIMEQLNDVDVFMMVHMRKMIFAFMCDIDEVELESFLMRPSVSKNVNESDVQQMSASGIMRFSRLTHGFGNRAMLTALKLQLTILKCMVESIDVKVKAGHYSAEMMEMAVKVVQEQQALDEEMKVESERRLVRKAIRMAEDQNFFKAVMASEQAAHQESVNENNQVNCVETEHNNLKDEIC